MLNHFPCVYTSEEESRVECPLILKMHLELHRCLKWKKGKKKDSILLSLPFFPFFILFLLLVFLPHLLTYAQPWFTHSPRMIMRFISKFATELNQFSSTEWQEN